MRNYHILLVNYEYPPLGGGGGIACKQIFEEAKRKCSNIEVDVLTAGSSDLSKEEKINGIRVYRIRSVGRSSWSNAPLVTLVTFPILGFLKGLELMRKNKYDIVYSWFAVPSGVLGLVLAKLFKRKHYLTIVGGDLYKPDQVWSPHRWFFFRWTVHLVTLLSNRLSAISNDVKTKAREWFGIKKEIDVLSLGSVFCEYDKKSREQLGLDESKLYLISVGRIIGRKGYNYLIEALAKLPENVESLIVSEGPDKKILENLAEKLGVRERVHFLGRLSDEEKFQYLEASDIYVMSSLHEGFGIVLVEAMYTGLPIVSTKCGGAEDIVKEGVNGIFARVADSDDLAQKIEKIVNDRNLRIKYGEKSREMSRDFTIKSVAEKYVKFLCE
ncbi:glycosyltransferase family 4 protein [Candidatus Dojkabacteria bacterium]|nr:glycosyltransferase family 4 protein [Candidatus Dojkabacteria bacterium]